MVWDRVLPMNFLTEKTFQHLLFWMLRYLIFFAWLIEEVLLQEGVLVTSLLLLLEPGILSSTMSETLTVAWWIKMAVELIEALEMVLLMVTQWKNGSHWC